jgi:hypothetical protein
VKSVPVFSFISFFIASKSLFQLHSYSGVKVYGKFKLWLSKTKYVELGEVVIIEG